MNKTHALTLAFGILIMLVALSVWYALTGYYDTALVVKFLQEPARLFGKFSATPTGKITSAAAVWLFGLVVWTVVLPSIQTRRSPASEAVAAPAHS